MLNKELWDKCVAFHGHECPGLSIGYRAALYAAKLLDLCFSEDEDVVCISENDACGVDAIQVILGCSAGKGNLLFHVVGKQAFSVYERKSGRSVRLVLKAMPEWMSREESFEYLHSQPDEAIFDVKPVKLELPERAAMFSSVACAVCGEMTAESKLCVRNGALICPDCAGKPYDRYHI